MKVRYFAWMKRTVGMADEEVAPPAEVETVGDLVVWPNECTVVLSLFLHWQVLGGSRIPKSPRDSSESRRDRAEVKCDAVLGSTMTANWSQPRSVPVVTLGRRTDIRRFGTAPSLPSASRESD